MYFCLSLVLCQSPSLFKPPHLYLLTLTPILAFRRHFSTIKSRITFVPFNLFMLTLFCLMFFIRETVSFYFFLRVLHCLTLCYNVITSLTNRFLYTSFIPLNAQSRIYFFYLSIPKPVYGSLGRNNTIL